MQTSADRFNIIQQLEKERSEVDAVLWGALNYYSDHNELMSDLLERYNRVTGLHCDIVGQYEKIIGKLKEGSADETR